MIGCRFYTGLVMALVFGLLTTLSVYAVPPPSVSQQDRVALVIGNANYKTAPLRNPRHDAEDMTFALKQMGFKVTTLVDASQRQMEEAIRLFSRELEQDSVGLFYYAGHGIQVGGMNYLLPVNADINSELEVKYEAVDVGRLLDAMDDVGNQLNIVILDACRDNPYARSWRSSQQGLASVQSASGMLIAYATAPGSVAADGRQRNGLFTHHLLHYMQTPNLPIENVFKRVRISVIKETGGKQTPWESSSLTGDFYFNRSTVPSVATASVRPSKSDTTAQRTASAAATAEAEAAAWEVVKESEHSQDLKAYLAQFPNGRFTFAARLKLTQLQRRESTPAPPLTAVAKMEPAQPITSVYKYDLDKLAKSLTRFDTSLTEMEELLRGGKSNTATRSLNQVSSRFDQLSSMMEEIGNDLVLIFDEMFEVVSGYEAHVKQQEMDQLLNLYSEFKGKLSDLQDRYDELKVVMKQSLPQLRMYTDARDHRTN